MLSIFSPAMMTGYTRFCRYDDDGKQLEQGTYYKNLPMYSWGKLTANSLIGKHNYRIAGMYLEFANVASAGDTVAIPTYDRTRTIAYYDNLASSDTADYLRVPLYSEKITESNTINTLDLSVRAFGVAGVHGKPFSYDSNSVIYGAALIAMVDDTDATRDILYSVQYHPAEAQYPKMSTGQLGFDWQLIFN